jgi:hypothetical protein
MTNESDPSDIEIRLRAFRPHRPKPIDEHFELRQSRAPFWLAVTAVVAAAVLVGWRVERAPRTPTDQVETPTLEPLTTLALTDPAEFDRALMRLSRASLPDVGRPGGAFEQLAKP